MTPSRRFAHLVRVDYEFVARPGQPPDVVCCAYKIDDEPTRVLWRHQLGAVPPYPIDDDTLVVSFTQAEWNCHLALRWKLPKHVIDLNCELRLLSNGLKLPAGQSLLGFCRWFGLEAGDAAVKDAIRARIIQGWPFTPEEKAADPQIRRQRRRHPGAAVRAHRAPSRSRSRAVSRRLVLGLGAHGISRRSCQRAALPPDRRSRHVERAARRAGAGAGHERGSTSSTTTAAITSASTASAICWRPRGFPGR